MKNMNEKLNDLFGLFEQEYYNASEWNEYLSSDLNKVCAFDDWFNRLSDDDIVDFLDIDYEEVKDCKDYVNKGIIAWMN